ncbi:hypothetical protein T492DRAFT_1124083, partial [Pavlovales sp. CCMP2436]
GGGEGEGGEGGEGGIDLGLLQAYSSVALEYARELRRTDGDGGDEGCGEVEWKCTKAIRGTRLVNGARFKADMCAPEYEGVYLTPQIGNAITFSPTSTIHSYQGITFEGGKLYLDMNMVWDVRMLYVARQFGLARSAGNGAIEEFPIGDGRYIADLDVLTGGKLTKMIEVVLTSPPSREKLAYYEELGIECEVIIPSGGPTPPEKKPTPPEKEPTNAPPSPPPMFSVDDSDEEHYHSEMSASDNFQALLQTNAKGAARRFENSDLLVGRKDTVKGSLIDSGNKNWLQGTYYSANMESLEILSEEDNVVHETCKTPEILRRFIASK